MIRRTRLFGIDEWGRGRFPGLSGKNLRACENRWRHKRDPFLPEKKGVEAKREKKKDS